MPRTLYQVLRETARTHGGEPALYEPLTRGGERAWKSWSWNEYQCAAEEIAAGLRSLGIGKGEVVALHSETRLEFYLADLGILTNGSIAAALYPTYPVADLMRSIAAIGARAVFVENSRALTSLRAS